MCAAKTSGNAGLEIHLLSSDELIHCSAPTVGYYRIFSAGFTTILHVRSRNAWGSPGGSGKCQLGEEAMASQDTLVHEIFSYFSQHPDTEDSLEAIATWRQQSIPSTRAAIDEMVKQRLLLTRQTAEGKTLYRLNPEKQGRTRRRVNRR